MNYQTQYAPAERANSEEIKRQVLLIKKEPLTRQFADSLPLFVTILNRFRQFVFLNKAFIEYLGYSEEKELLGLRPGEAVNCVHAFENDAGCGTTEFCRYCGAVNAILEAQKGIQNQKECRIVTKDNKALDLLVWATPIKIRGESFTIFALKDIQHKNRLKALERIFFHDILNTAGSLKGFVSLLIDTDDLDEIKEYSQFIFNTTNKLIEEILAQKDLLAAEKNDLNPVFEKSSAREIVNSAINLYEHHPLSEGKKIEFSDKCSDAVISTDKVLLRRVLSNLIKNALEASKDGKVVTIGCMNNGDKIIFFVHSQSFMPEYVQKQIFQRSFSTKGADRGLGTYSVKLITEKYLGGRVFYESDKFEGTTFFVEIPK